MTTAPKQQRDLSLLLVGLGCAVLMAGLATPYVIHNALAYAGTVTSQTTIKGSQAAPPVSFYLDPNQTYNLYLVAGTGETDAVVTTTSVPVGSLVFVNSSVAEWYVTSLSQPLNAGAGQSYDRLIVAGSVDLVSGPLASSYSYFTGTVLGKVILAVSEAALAVPILFLIAVRMVTRKWALWPFVIAAWFFAMIPFATDVVGGGYGQAVSATLGLALVGLPVLAYVTNRLETQVRARLAATR